MTKVDGTSEYRVATDGVIVTGTVDAAEPEDTAPLPQEPRRTAAKSTRKLRTAAPRKAASESVTAGP